jgi:hypothetical protein
MRQFGVSPSFWQGLVGRAGELELSRPLYYALRYAASVLDTPIPAEVVEQAQYNAPGPLTQLLMDRIFHQVFSAPHPAEAGWRLQLARWLLFVRGHWLRMPPLLLARHLLHKAFVSPASE